MPRRRSGPRAALVWGMVQRPNAPLPAADVARVLFGLIVPRTAVAEVAPPAASEAPAPATPEAPRGDSGRSSFVRGAAPWSDAARAFLRAGAPPATPLLPVGPVLRAQGSHAEQRHADQRRADQRPHHGPGPQAGAGEHRLGDDHA